MSSTDHHQFFSTRTTLSNSAILDCPRLFRKPVSRKPMSAHRTTCPQSSCRRRHTTLSRTSGHSVVSSMNFVRISRHFTKPRHMRSSASSYGTDVSKRRLFFATELSEQERSDTTSTEGILPVIGQRHQSHVELEREYSCFTSSLGCSPIAAGNAAICGATAAT